MLSMCSQEGERSSSQWNFFSVSRPMQLFFAFLFWYPTLISTFFPYILYSTSLIQIKNDKYNRLFYLQPYVPVYIIVFFFFGSLIWRSSHLLEILRIALIWKNKSRLKIEINLLLEENLIQNVRNLPFVEELQVGSRIAEEYRLVDVLAG